jgi:hypothetical protein
MPAGLQISPAMVLAMWAGGIAAGAALIAWWRIVGRGFIWLAAAVAGVLGAGAAAAGGGIPAVLGAVFAGLAILFATRPKLASLLLAASAGVLVSSAALGWDPLLAISGAVALGAVTDEMLLGHWYLVDPRLPRWALRTLAVTGLAAAAVDGVLLLVRGAWPAGGSVMAWAFVVAAIATVILMAAVLGALRQPSYTGVMAATGLSYLAVITSLAATVLGRSLLPV